MSDIRAWFERHAFCLQDKSGDRREFSEPTSVSGDPGSGRDLTPDQVCPPGPAAAGTDLVHHLHDGLDRILLAATEELLSSAETLSRRLRHDRDGARHDRASEKTPTRHCPRSGTLLDDDGADVFRASMIMAAVASSRTLP